MTETVVSLDVERRKRVLTTARLTDLGNAERLVAMHGDELRYVPRAKKWYVWDGKRWAIDDTLEVQRRAKRTMRALLHEAIEMEGGDTRDAYLKHATASEANSRLKAAVERAAAESGVAVLPDAFDAPPMVMNVENGVLDLATGELRAHDRGLLMTKLVRIEYPEREAAECPVWCSFLDRVFAGDAALIAYLQRAIGYTLTADTREQCLHLLYGTGANGKSTFLEVLALLLGDYAIAADFSTFLDKVRSDGPRNDIARLAGARLVRSSEIGEGKRFNEALVKTLTGGEKISARFLYAEDFEFTPTFKLWFSFNHKPVIRGTDHAIWRRVRLIPFEVTIADAEKDDTLLAKLKTELPGILRWAVDGCIAWRRDGLKPPESVIAATEEYRSESDTLAAFVDDRCAIGNAFEVRAGDLYMAYKLWAEKGSEYVMNQTVFGRKMEERGHHSEKRGGVKYRRGIRLLVQPKAESDASTLF